MNSKASAGNHWWKLVPLILLVVGLVWWLRKDEPASAGTPPDYDQKVENLVASEEWIELMGAWLNSRADLIESIPSDGMVDLFSWSNGASVGGSQVEIEEESMGPVTSKVARLSNPMSGQPAEEQVLWDLSLDQVVEVRDGKFGFLRGAFVNEARTEFESLVVFSAKGKLANGKVASFESQQEIRWELMEGGTAPSRANDYLIDPKEWAVADWKVKEARILRAEEQPLFVEVTDEVIPNEADRRLIESTKHAEFLDKLFSGGKIPLKSEYGRYFTTDATAQHPALSVVDLNGDGWDDLYVCVRWGRNLFFQNKGDGTFEEAAADYGLDFEGLSAAALFADFDNDGDQDLFLGRSLERSLYLRNDNGFFVDCSESHVAVPLPYLTTSLAAADYNGDGLLDVYFSTYGFAIRQPRDQVAKSFLAEHAPDEVEARFVSPPDVETYLNLPGPPNVLLLNQGDGRFAKSPVSNQVAVWHETLQSTWADYDLDGDPDLYVCNDFAPDQLFRNDNGETFVDVTSSVGHQRMRGFGMGASFGDFDNDLDLDLYVSNMFSKAGLRIIDQIGMKDERFRWSAEGNLLFSNQEGKRFDFASTPWSSFGVVAKADWSWGGQFGDFDNDGFLDLYVPNGYFTAPEQFAGEADL
jgi:hypothetical protein